jgi:hypothetical protein
MNWTFAMTRMTDTRTVRIPRHPDGSLDSETAIARAHLERSLAFHRGLGTVARAIRRGAASLPTIRLPRGLGVRPAQGLTASACP